MRADSLSEAVARALAEDLGPGDITTEATVSAEARARARVVQKAPGVAFGFDAVEETLRQCGIEHVDLDRLVVEGQWRQEVPAEVLLAGGPARALLAAERTALNFLGHLSGIATLTARYAAAVEGTGARILDTRKTTPGLRGLEKAAVAAGGGINHRVGPLRRDPDQGEPRRSRRRGRQGGRTPRAGVSRACRSRSSAATSKRSPTRSASAPSGCCSTTWTREALRAAVRLRDENAGGGDGPTLEASGGVDLGTVRAVAETGVDFISVGALTHSAPSLDFSLLLEPAT